MPCAIQIWYENKSWQTLFIFSYAYFLKYVLVCSWNYPKSENIKTPSYFFYHHFIYDIFFSNAKVRINTHNGDVLHKEARVINLIHTCHGIHKHENVDFVALMVISFKIHSLFINKCKYVWQGKLYKYKMVRIRNIIGTK